MKQPFPAAQVLYNLCEWPARPGSRLALVGIANTLDLPDRLAPRIASRLGSRRRACAISGAHVQVLQATLHAPTPHARCLGSRRWAAFAAFCA